MSSYKQATQEGRGCPDSSQKWDCFIVRSGLERLVSETEAILIKVEQNVFGPSNLVVGVINRMPDTLMETSNDRMNDWLNSIQREKKYAISLEILT